MKSNKTVYPYVPKSANSLRPGDFWALPLSDGSFGCGRVVQIPPKGVQISTMHFLAAILDWQSAGLPTVESIAGARCLDQGSAHIKVITTTGGCVLGFRELSLDGVEPWLFREFDSWINSRVLHGAIPIRPQTPEDESLPVLSTFGFNVPRLIAEKRFVVRTETK